MSLRPKAVFASKRGAPVEDVVVENIDVADGARLVKVVTKLITADSGLLVDLWLWLDDVDDNKGIKRKVRRSLGPPAIYKVES
jgi:hypothetical protein